jgi:hypothetical protein
MGDRPGQGQAWQLSGVAIFDHQDAAAQFILQQARSFTRHGICGFPSPNDENTVVAIQVVSASSDDQPVSLALQLPPHGRGWLNRTQRPGQDALYSFPSRGAFQ